MTQHPTDHEELLLSIAAGELAPDDPTVQSRRATCADCKRRIDAILAVIELLDDDARDAEQILAEAARIGSAPGEDRILALARHPEIRGSAPPARERRFPLWQPALAAAAAVVALLWFARQPAPGTEESEPRMLGEQTGITASAPIGASGFDRFAWTVEGAIAERARSYSLVIEAAGFFEEVAGLGSTEWSDPPRTQSFPDSIGWWVEAYDATGALLARSPRVAAQRSP